jgi:hypothetical protein
MVRSCIQSNPTTAPDKIRCVVRDDLKLPDDSGKVPKLNGEVGDSIPGCEIVFLLDGKLARWSSASCIPKRKKSGVPQSHLYSLGV